MQMLKPALPQPLIGVFFMLGAMASLPFIDVLAKFLGQQNVPILQVVWARVLFGAVLTLPLALRKMAHDPRTGKGAALRALWPQRPLFHLARASMLMIATFGFFASLKHLPIADALAIFFVQPLIVTLLSAWTLGEKVQNSSWVAIFVGFLGTLIIIRPGMGEINPGSFLALIAGVSLAVYFVMTRRISGEVAAVVTTFQTNAIGAGLLIGVMPFVWVAPTPEQWAMMMALGAIATFGHFLIVRAYDYAEASLLAPLAYSEMIMATFVGWYFFGDLPDRYTVLGVTILIGCAVYISLSEHGRQKADLGDHL
jgi:drug/metabolite transporter (DMT)-like permease